MEAFRTSSGDSIGSVNILSSSPSTNSFPMANKSDSPLASSIATSIVSSPSKIPASPITNSTGNSMPGAIGQIRPTPAIAQAPDSAKVLDKKRIHELVREVDPLEQLDEDVEEMLMQVADDFIENVVTAACQLAKHRKSNVVEEKDVQLHLQRNWNMLIPGFGSEDIKPLKKSSAAEAHRQRLALIKKTLKKY